MSKKNHTAVLGAENCPAALSDACAGLLAGFTGMTQDTGAKCVMVASAVSGEGVAETAANLAASLGETGAKVVLLDCDLRCGAVQTRLDASAPAEKCLSSVLAGGEVKPAAVRQNGFYFVPAGMPAKNPTVLLSSPRMRSLLDDLRQHFDYVICAAPPVNEVPDAAVLGRLCDGAVLVVRHRYAPRRMITEAAARLDKSGVKLLGSVLSGYDLTLARKMGRPYAGYGVGAK